jgi:hypothetical protein
VRGCRGWPSEVTPLRGPVVVYVAGPTRPLGVLPLLLTVLHRREPEDGCYAATPLNKLASSLHLVRGSVLLAVFFALVDGGRR